MIVQDRFATCFYEWFERHPEVKVYDGNVEVGMTRRLLKIRSSGTVDNTNVYEKPSELFLEGRK